MKLDSIEHNLLVVERLLEETGASSFSHLLVIQAETEHLYTA
jgi:hypothetical protein